jgi:hypothetical protein
LTNAVLNNQTLLREEVQNEEHKIKTNQYIFACGGRVGWMRVRIPSGGAAFAGRWRVCGERERADLRRIVV